MSLKQDLKTVPNLLSITRIISPYAAIFMLWIDYPFTGLFIGTVGGLTDLFDGIIARKTGRITKIGGLLDQLGDLLFESTIIIFAIWVGALPVLFIYIYLFREFVVLSVRSFLALEGKTVPSRLLGKSKTSFIQYAFFILFISEAFRIHEILPARHTEAWLFIAAVAIGIGLVQSLISGAWYISGLSRLYNTES